MTTSVVILQPPLVQLNGPYPSGAYLAAFFRSLAAQESGSQLKSVRWIDVSNLFFHHLFSSSGVRRLFSLSGEAALNAALQAEASGDINTAYQLRRYLSLADRWTLWIDDIVSILCGGERELCHAFVRSPYAPRGARMDAFLSELASEPGADDARVLATLAIEDLADFITSVFDSEFSLVRYAESLAMSEHSFANIEAALDRPVVTQFLEPLLAELWEEIGEMGRPDGKILFCISVPFPGCLVAALAMARSLRLFFGDRAVISMGGGYVNTELRAYDRDSLFSYIDQLSFDRGFGGYADYFRKESSSHTMPRRIFCPPDLEVYEDRVTASIVPDYSDIDFSRYPRLADNPNPMHRLWSDGAWIKAYLAHGCYWHRCSFCDVYLDYICSYRMVDVPKLYAGLRAQALAVGVRGIHLVDEAAPPRALRDFATENLRAAWQVNTPHSDHSPHGAGLLSFWGNIRFEKTFSRDLADYIASGGLVGVSGGIEIASPEGFKAVDKGIDLENLVAVCAAFKEAGVLVHSYLIYGYWNEDAQGVIDSAEVMRQLFAAGLVDSAFWHKFVLTRHSRVFREWEKGMHRGGMSGTASASSAALVPIIPSGDFAENDLRFEGEEDSARYTAPLDSALLAWTAGDGLDKPVKKWFPFPMPSPKIASDLIDSYIAAYEKRRDHEWNAPFDQKAHYRWIASAPVPVGTELVWWHLGEEVRLPVNADQIPTILAAVSADTALSGNTAALAGLPRAIFKALRHHGLCRIHPL